MSKKDNFKKAAYDMFGVGSNRSAEEVTNTAIETPVAPIEVTASVEEPVVVAEPEPVVEAEPIVEPEPVVEPEPIAAPVAQPAFGGSATYLAPGTVMEGTLRSQGDVEIAGTFKGDIIAEGNVTLHTNIDGNITANNLSLIDCCVAGDCTAASEIIVDEKSSIIGNIVAEEMLCSGNITGDITVAGNATFERTAVLDANITAGTIVRERGAKISGQLNMRG